MEATTRPSPSPGAIAPTRAQAAAIAAPPGPMLILAGPGAGKTLTLTRRAARLARLLDASAVGSLHHVHEPGRARARDAARPARGRQRPRGHVPRDRAPARPAVRGARRPQRRLLDLRQPREPQARRAGDRRPRATGSTPGRAADAISLAKARLETAATVARRDAGLAAVWSRYERLLRESDALDFDDLIARAVGLLELPRGRRAAVAALRRAARRRVPGHEPRPVPAGRAARGGAPQRDGDLRRRPGDLRLPLRRRRATSPTSSAASRTRRR